MKEKKDRASREAIPVGVSLLIGAGIGTVLFALTSNPVWIALGAGLGFIVGTFSARWI
jgi:membrane protein YdbS with pleckstrin-like domain